MNLIDRLREFPSHIKMVEHANVRDLLGIGPKTYHVICAFPKVRVAVDIESNQEKLALFLSKGWELVNLSESEIETSIDQHIGRIRTAIATGLDYNRSKDWNLPESFMPSITRMKTRIFDPLFEPVPARRKFKSWMMSDNNWCAEPKMNGHRMVLQFTKDSVIATSRHTSKKTGFKVNNSRSVPHLTEFPIPALAGTVLDGEVCAGDDKAWSATRILGCLPKKACDRQQEQGWLKFFVFGMPFFRGQDLRDWPDRRMRELMLWVWDSFLTPLYSHLTPLSRAFGTKDKEVMLQSEWARGGEGIILKNLHGKYSHRSWAKVKASREFDCVIIGTLPPKQFTKKSDGEVSESRLWSNGWIGSLVLGQYKDGRLVKVCDCSGMDDSTRADISSDPEFFKGNVVKVRAQERTPDNKLLSPRFIEWRYDKDPEQCTVDEVG